MKMRPVIHEVSGLSMQETLPTSAPITVFSRPEVITAGLIVLLNAYRCRGCAHLATCIVSHCRALRAHPDVDPVLRQLAAHLENEWCPLAIAPSLSTSKQRH